MNTTHILNRNSIILLICAFLLAGVFTPTPALADPPHRRPGVGRHGALHSRFVGRGDFGHRRIHAVRARPYFHRGSLYRRGTRSFVQLGFVFSSLPVGYSTVFVHGSPYYCYGGTYYRRVPSGYMVVEAPPEVVVVNAAPQETKPAVAVPAEVEVTAAGLNVRTGPGLDYPAIDQVQRGDTLQVIGAAPGWFHVELESGQTGWIMDSFTVAVTSPVSG